MRTPASGPCWRSNRYEREASKTMSAIPACLAALAIFAAALIAYVKIVQRF